MSTAKQTKVESKLSLGEVVQVKTGVRDPDFNADISGWVGRVVELDAESELCLLKWDSKTLRQMPDSFLEKAEEEGIDWETIWLSYEEVEPTTAQDGPEDADRVAKERERDVTWVGLGPQGLLIQKILEGVDENDSNHAFETWRRYLENALRFPFVATVVEPRGLFDRTYTVTVKSLASVHPVYGILAKVTREGGWFSRRVPLCDIEVDEGSPNSEPLSLYSLWFDNS